MSFKKVLGWLGFGALFLPVFASCAHNPESFCESWVEDTCQALKGCCPSELKFDPEGCRLQYSAACQSALDVEKVHSGEYVFDSGAASSCFIDVATCSDVATTTKTSYELTKACANAVTGYRPVGSACGSSHECAKAGDFPVCFKGPGGAGDGICAKAVLADDNKCGYSVSTGELRFCPDGKFCDTSDFKPDPNDPPTTRDLEFSATCRSYAHEGDDCSGMNAVPCEDGLYCDFTNGSVCAQLKGEGDDCTAANECSPGLTCKNDPNGMGQICGQAGAGYCYNPSVCGDGACDLNAGESPTTCPEDCGSPGGCGDGVCDFNNGEAGTCPQDCCGDGFCDPGEAAVCPGDCGG